MPSELENHLPCLFRLMSGDEIVVLDLDMDRSEEISTSGWQVLGIVR